MTENQSHRIRLKDDELHELAKILDVYYNLTHPDRHIRDLWKRTWHGHISPTERTLVEYLKERFHTWGKISSKSKQKRPFYKRRRSY